MKLTKSQKVVTFEPETEGFFEVYEETGKLLAKGEGVLSWESTEIHPVVRIHGFKTDTYLAQRDIPETKITNFRDLGGYPTEDGKQVRYHMLYRCAPVVAKDEEAKQVLTSLGIKTIMDFRSDGEAEKDPDTELKDCEIFQIGAIHMEGNAFGGNLDFKALMEKADIETLKNYMKKTYRELPFDNEAYRIMFQRLLENKAPLAFHCTAGKDRTGVGAYLILKTLGVADEVILQDYLLSNVYRKEENEKIRQYAGAMGDAVMSLMMVYEEYLQTTMDEIAQRYPDFKTFLLQEYGITEDMIQQLRKMYLYQ